MPPIRVVVVTDRSSNDTLMNVLETTPDIVVHGLVAPDAGMPRSSTLISPDVVILDIDQTRLNPDDTTRAVRRAYPQARILIYASTPEHLSSALLAGADGYLLNKTSPPDLLEAIRSVYAGKTVVSMGLVHHLFGFSNKHSHHFHR